MGKVKFGLSSFEYGIVDVANKVATTKKLPGMKSAKLSITNELVTHFPNDGTIYQQGQDFKEKTINENK